MSDLIEAEQTYFNTHPSYRVSLIHYTLMKEDSRYQKIFNTLKNMGYKPRRSAYYPWFGASEEAGKEEAITISSMNREIPNDVREYLNSFEDIYAANESIYVGEISKGVPGYKIKFCLYDKELQRIHDEFTMNVLNKKEIKL